LKNKKEERKFMYENSAIETAARFGEIPFTEFTSELISSTFDTLIDANIRQMEAYVDMVNALEPGLTNYVNNTVDSVSMQEISDFVNSLNLPSPTETNNLIATLQKGFEFNVTPPTTPAQIVSNELPSANTLTTIINAVAPIAKDLVGKIRGQDGTIKLNENQTLQNVQESFLKHTDKALPNYNILYQSIAATIASNKYSLLQNMAKMGLLRLVVTDGQIETRITFQTWEEHEKTDESGHSDKTRSKNKETTRLSLGIFGRRTKDKTRTITVNTAKSYQRDTSGSKVEIFGRVLINFKTDYMPLNF
jgi:hypothetical protein